MRVFVKYRNYKPLHANFKSMLSTPPVGVEYTIPPVKTGLNRGFSIYRRLGRFKVVQWLIGLAQRYYFERSQSGLGEYDMVHIIDMIPSDYDQYPFVVDVSHVISLANYAEMTEDKQQAISAFFLHENCKTIIARTAASKQSILHFASDYLNTEEQAVVAAKTTVIYPTHAAGTSDLAAKYAARPSTLRLLYVGNGPFNKGLQELILAYGQLKDQGQDVSLTVVANDYDAIDASYLREDIRFERARFSKQEVLELFAEHDVFVMPSHHELFGMVFIDAFSEGLPVIAIDQYSSPEIVVEGTGILIRSEKRPLDDHRYPDRNAVDVRQFYEPEQLVVDGMQAAISQYLQEPALVEQHGRAGYATVADGVFSLQRRNKQLLAAYQSGGDGQGEGAVHAKV